VRTKELEVADFQLFYPIHPKWLLVADKNGGNWSCNSSISIHSHSHTPHRNFRFKINGIEMGKNKNQQNLTT
jgi:hypothetical protein